MPNRGYSLIKKRALNTHLARTAAVWTDTTDRKFDAYRLSKILAERAAWDFMAAERGRATLTTILPGAVFGPVLTKDNLGSVQVIERLLQGHPPGIPSLGFWVVDVRDLAELHIRAMTSPGAAGERFIASGDFDFALSLLERGADVYGEHSQGSQCRAWDRTGERSAIADPTRSGASA